MTGDSAECEPCSYFDDHFPSIARIGWDFTPVCDFHNHHSWSSRRPQSDRVGP